METKNKIKEKTDTPLNVNIISFGGGVNSTAMIIEMFNRNIKIDEIIFADTYDEMPETYDFMKSFKTWIESHDLKLTTVESHLGGLKDHYFSKNIIPYRMFRSCTDKFKIRPIKKYLKEQYGDLKNVNMYLGIDYGEKKRVKENDVYNSLNYPLVDWKIDREACKDIIKQEGLEVPIKSGCYFCPFQTKKKWIELLNTHPELFEQSFVFEENCTAFPEGTFTDMPLRKLMRISKEQTNLKDFLEPIKVEKCVYCHL